MLQAKAHGAKIGLPRWQSGSLCKPLRQDPGPGRLSHLQAGPRTITPVLTALPSAVRAFKGLEAAQVPGYPCGSSGERPAGENGGLHPYAEKRGPYNNASAT